MERGGYLETLRSCKYLRVRAEEEEEEGERHKSLVLPPLPSSRWAPQSEEQLRSLMSPGEAPRERGPAFLPAVGRWRWGVEGG